VVVFSSQLARWLLRNLQKSNKVYVLKEMRSVFFLQIIIWLAIVYPFLILKVNGANISDFLSLEGLLTMNKKMADLRYSGGFSEPMYCQLFLVFVYLAPLYGGFLYAQVKKELKKYCLIAILPSFVLVMFTNAKLGLILSVILWCAAYFVCCIFLQKPVLGKIGIKRVLKLTAVIVAFVGILFTSMIFRTGKIDGKTIDAIKVKFGVYLFGGLPAADVWYDDYLKEDDHDYHYGARTFSGISNFLDISKREQGIFKDNVVFSNYNDKPLESNIFTSFRCVIEDYGLIGSVFFFLIIGFFASYSYYQVKIKRNIYINMIIFISLLSMYLCSWLQPVVTVYTSTLLAMILLYFVLKCSYSQIQAT
jgi:oligosaccharide repeat unit polymerase